MNIDPRIQKELDRSDVPYIRLRGYAERLRAHRTVAEEKMRLQIGSQYWFQVPLLSYVLDFLHPKALIDVEIDGPLHSKYPRKDSNRAYVLYKKLGIYTIRFSNEEVMQDIDLCMKKLKQFRRNPIAPPKWQSSLEDEKRRKLRVQTLKIIRERVSKFEENMIGKTRSEVMNEFNNFQPQDDLDVEVLERLSQLVAYWPELGYAARGLQVVTARKKSLPR